MTYDELHKIERVVKRYDKWHAERVQIMEEETGEPDWIDLVQISDDELIDIAGMMAKRLKAVLEAEK